MAPDDSSAAPSSASAPDPARCFGSVVDAYERGRPGYPIDAVRWLTGDEPLSVLELGAGTGKLTRLLVHEFGCVVGVEPDPSMRRWFMKSCPNAQLVGGTAEQIPLADESVDGVFVAEAFHWFDHERALAEIARVLRPAGTLTLMWNRPSGSIEPAIAYVEWLLERYWPDEVELPLDLDPRRLSYAREWQQAFTDSAFAPLDDCSYPNPHRVDRDGLLAYLGSMGWIDALPDDERAALLENVRFHLTADDYVLPFETRVHWTRLTGR